MKRIFVDMDDTQIGYSSPLTYFLRCGVEGTLWTLSKYAKLYVLSANYRDFINSVLEEFKIRKYFRAIYDQQNILYDKPNNFKDALLIDDMPTNSDLVQAKLKWIGTNPDNHIKVEPASFSKICLNEYLPIILDRIM